MYSEMTFYYKGIEAAVYYDEYGNICLEYSEHKDIFPSAEEFYDNARVDGKLLKDVWNKVEKADYMQGWIVRQSSFYSWQALETIKRLRRRRFLF